VVVSAIQLKTEIQTAQHVTPSPLYTYTCPCRVAVLHVRFFYSVHVIQLLFELRARRLPVVLARELLPRPTAVVAVRGRQRGPSG